MVSAEYQRIMATYDVLEAVDGATADERECVRSQRMEEFARAAYEVDAKRPYSLAKCVRCRRDPRANALMCGPCQQACNDAWEELHS